MMYTWVKFPRKLIPQNDDGKLRRIMILTIMNSVKPMSKPKKKEVTTKNVHDCTYVIMNVL